MRVRRFGAALFWVAAPLLAGCLRSSTLVKLNPDGSGTLELTTMCTKDLEVDDTEDAFSIKEARAAARELGNGVTFVSSAKIETPPWTGIKAIYAFKDIRTVSLAELNPPEGLALWDKADDLVHFTFSRLPNGHSLLTIENVADPTPDVTPPQPPGSATPAAGSSPEEKQMFDAMVAMLAGAKVEFTIQVARLVKTNIPHVNGGRVTLLGVDFDQVLADPASIEKIQNAYSVGRKALERVKGIKLNLDPKLTIEFRN